MGQVQQPEAPETAPAAQDTQNANEQQDPDPEWEDWVYLSTNDQLAPDDHFQYLNDHRDPGWPDYVLPRMICIPDGLRDDNTRQEHCLCLQVDTVKGLFGPFSLQDKCYCWTCMKPVTPGQTPTKSGGSSLRTG